MSVITFRIDSHTIKRGETRIEMWLSQSGPNAGLARPISGSSEDAGIVLRLDAGSLHDRTLAGCIRSC